VSEISEGARGRLAVRVNRTHPLRAGGSVADVEASEAETGGYFSLSRLTRGELGGCAAGVVLVLSLFLPWFATSAANPNSKITTAGIGPGESANAFQVFSVLDWLFVAAATAPFILAWIVARAHKLTWKPGEVTMIVGITGFVLIVCNGIILGKPDPGIEISFRIGYFVGMLACLAMALSGYLRQSRYTEGRKPPGVI
jgi:hypothetical protein